MEKEVDLVFTGIVVLAILGTVASVAILRLTGVDFSEAIHFITIPALAIIVSSIFFIKSKNKNKFGNTVYSVSIKK